MLFEKPRPYIAVKVHDRGGKKDLYFLATDEDMAEERARQMGREHPVAEQIPFTEVTDLPVYERAEEWADKHKPAGRPELDTFFLYMG